MSNSGDEPCVPLSRGALTSYAEADIGLVLVSWMAWWKVPVRRTSVVAVEHALFLGPFIKKVTIA